jgi:hypothetical protein
VPIFIDAGAAKLAAATMVSAKPRIGLLRRDSNERDSWLESERLEERMEKLLE